MESNKIQLTNKILFLDMDGVVNSNFLIRNYLNNLEAKGYDYDKIKEIYYKEFNHCKELIFPELAQKITEICNKTNCNIVWSSSWKKLPCYQNIENAKTMFNKRGLPGNKLISYTPSRLSDTNRSYEIKTWIKDHGKHISKFAIIDDRPDAKYNTQRCKFFQTNPEDGITNTITNNIISWLNS